MNNTHSFALTFFSSPFLIILLVIFLLLVIGSFVLVAVIIKLSTRLKYITYPVYDQVIKEAQRKANDIINDAQVQSRSIHAIAQENAEKILSERKEENDKFHEEYAKHFEEIVINGRNVLTNQSAELAQLSKNIADEFKKHILTAEVLVQKESETVSDMLTKESEKIEQSFATMSAQAAEGQRMLVEETKKHVAEEITKEISMVRDAIVAYKQERFAILDREVVGLIEETARIALNKTFSLREHRDQVLSALQEAKEKSIFEK